MKDIQERTRRRLGDQNVPGMTLLNQLAKDLDLLALENDAWNAHFCDA